MLYFTITEIYIYLKYITVKVIVIQNNIKVALTDSEAMTSSIRSSFSTVLRTF